MTLRSLKICGAAAGAGLLFLALAGLPAESFPTGSRSSFFTPPSLTHQVFQYVDWKYVDPERSEPSDLLRGALMDLEKRYPAVLIDWEPGSDTVIAKVDEKSTSIPVPVELGYSAAAEAIESVLAFVAPLIDHDVDEQMLRYMTLNGALGELDPHSNVFSQKHYKDFKVRTSGSFGGIGFTFGVHDGDLTIISPIPDTPADRAGLQSGDRILFIDGEPTTNMGTDAAVGRMRGKPSSKVTLTIGREGWAEPRDFTIIREIIRIVSVESHTLEGDGETSALYVSIKNFQENTSMELEKAITAGVTEKTAGIIIDLRNNPGGLLQQAIEISDGFLSEGVIVSTRSRDLKKKPRFAGSKDRLYTDKPVVILINRGSASASEIVAGALQETRAIVIGRTSFGKGSVQQAYQLMDGGGLLLTVSQYLTPGDISIQSIGIKPDIILNPAIIDEKRVSFSSASPHGGEANLDNAFSDWGNAQREAEATVSYYRPPADKKERDILSRPRGTEKVAELKKEFEVRLARRILGAVGPSGSTSHRAALLDAARSVLPGLEKQEQSLISSALGKAGINWTAPDDGGTDTPELSILFPDGLDLPAGETSDVTLTVANNGKAPAYRVVGRTESANPLLNNLDFPFGFIPPGEKRSWTTAIEVPVNADRRWDTVNVSLFDASERDLGSFTGGIGTRAGTLPDFAYSFAIEDENSENSARSGDGILEEGERVSLQLTVQNSGTRSSSDVEINLHADEKENFYLDKVRQRLEDIPAGEKRETPLSFRLLEAKEDGEVEMRITITDRGNNTFFSDSLKLQTGKPYPRVQSRIPPRIAVSGEIPVRTDSDSILLKLEVSDDEEVKEVYAYSGEKKVRYSRNRDHGTSFPLEVKMPLEEGSNRLLVVARDQKNITSQKVFFVFRSGPKEALSEVHADGEAKN